MLSCVQVLDAREKAALEERFQATMARHRERIYMLEKHKRLVQAQPAQDIDIWHNKVGASGTEHAASPLPARSAVVLAMQYMRCMLAVMQRTKAAARIQAAWRGYVQRKIFARMDPERAKREAVSGETHANTRMCSYRHLTQPEQRQRPCTPSPSCS